MIDTKFKVRRYIAEYSKVTEKLLIEYNLSSFELNKFQVEFGVQNIENAMFNCYPVKKRNVEFIKKYLAKNPEWDFVNKSYFVEARAI